MEWLRPKDIKISAYRALTIVVGLLAILGLPACDVCKSYGDVKAAAGQSGGALECRGSNADNVTRAKNLGDGAREAQNFGTTVESGIPTLDQILAGFFAAQSAVDAAPAGIDKATGKKR